MFAVRASTNLDTIAGPVPIGGAAPATSDQFLPVAALDDSNGDLWACFYDTVGDPTRKSAWFTCALSRDGGRRWSALVHASSRPGNEALDGAGTFGYGDRAGLVALDGVAHPVWTDNRNSLSTEEDVFTAAIRAPTR